MSILVAASAIVVSLSTLPHSPGSGSCHVVADCVVHGQQVVSHKSGVCACRRALYEFG